MVGLGQCSGLDEDEQGKRGGTVRVKIELIGGHWMTLIDNDNRMKSRSSSCGLTIICIGLILRPTEFAVPDS